MPALPAGVAAPPDLLALLFGGSACEPRRLGGSAQVVAAGAAQVTASPQIDQLLDTATQNGHPGTRIPDQQVGSDGAISIPYAGRIKAAGRTPQQIEHTIEQRLADKALDPQALV